MDSVTDNFSFYPHQRTPVFFNRGSAEAQGFASGRQVFRRNRRNLPGTKFVITVLWNCRSVDTWIIA